MIKRAGSMALVIVSLAGCSLNTPTGTGTTIAAPTSDQVVAKIKIKMPNMVGKNHQESQDYLQSKGFYKLAEEDATGADRLLIFDRNWVVVRQRPKAGTLVDPSEVTVTLYSKKVGE